MTEHKKDRLTKRLLATQAHSYQSVLFESFTGTAPSLIQSIGRNVHGMSYVECCTTYFTLLPYLFIPFLKRSKVKIIDNKKISCKKGTCSQNLKGLGYGLKLLQKSV